MPNPKPAAIKAEIPKSIGRPGGGGLLSITTFGGGGFWSPPANKVALDSNSPKTTKAIMCLTLTSIIRA